MKSTKLLLAVMGAAVLLGVLVTSASANHLGLSSLAYKTTWTRAPFRGGFGTIECEVSLAGSFHERTIAKTVALIGYITAGSVIRCSRGGLTINQSSLPWHREYRSFAGTLPNITGISETVDGSEWTIREQLGITCTIRRTSSVFILTHGLMSGVVTSESISGVNPCDSFTSTLEGTTERVEDGAGHRLTITLI